MDKQMQREVLKWILGQVNRAEKHKAELEERLMRISAERDSPIGSPGYDPLPRSPEPGAGAASILFKLSEIEERIYAQKTEIEKSIVRVMDIIDFIPQTETARRIFELRHIDCMSWQEVADAIPMARSGCHEHYNKALDRLLEFPKIQAMVTEAEGDYIAWCMDREKPKKQSGGMNPGYKTGNPNRKKRRKK